MPSFTGDGPEQKMPMWRYVTSLVIAAMFDVFRLVFNNLIFWAPAIAGQAAEYYAKFKGSSDFTAHIIGLVAGVGTGAAEILFPELTLIIKYLGIIMAVLVVAIGWIFFFMWFAWARVSIFGHKNIYLTVSSWIIGEIPLLNAGIVATFTPAVFLIVNDERKADKKRLKEWKEKQEEELNQYNLVHLKKLQRQRELLQQREYQRAFDMAEDEEQANTEGYQEGLEQTAS